MRGSRTYGSVRAKAKWLSYSTMLGGASLDKSQSSDTHLQVNRDNLPTSL